MCKICMCVQRTPIESISINNNQYSLNIYKQIFFLPGATWKAPQIYNIGRAAASTRCHVISRLNMFTSTCSHPPPLNQHHPKWVCLKVEYRWTDWLGMLWIIMFNFYGHIMFGEIVYCQTHSVVFNQSSQFENNVRCKTGFEEKKCVVHLWKHAKMKNTCTPIRPSRV